jgi:predicted site-specific integrase-resolvase
MKLSKYAKQIGISYRTAQTWFSNGDIDGAYQMPSGTIIVPDKTIMVNKPPYIVIYARVSSSENKKNLDTQADRLQQYANMRGYQVAEIIKEIGSGINDNRSKLNRLLSNEKVTRIIIEHKDRLTRFGFNYIKILLQRANCEIEIINSAETSKEDLIQDFISIITSFCARIYGQRRNKRKTAKLLLELEHD